MYEMEGPRLISRRRPADFSASFAPLDRLPEPVTLPAARSGTGSPVARVTRAGWLRLARVPSGRGSPQARKRSGFLRRPAPGFLSAT
jgi:hypothetical protein